MKIVSCFFNSLPSLFLATSFLSFFFILSLFNHNKSCHVIVVIERERERERKNWKRERKRHNWGAKEIKTGSKKLEKTNCLIEKVRKRGLEEKKRKRGCFFNSFHKSIGSEWMSHSMRISPG